MEWFKELSPLIQVLLATLFTWGLTALGAAVVFFMKEMKQSVMDGMLGFAAGVMIAASVWSLIMPALDLAEGGKLPSWLVVTIGFLAGGFFLRLVDRFLPHLHIGDPIEKAEGVKSHFKKSALLVLAITLHNIPEGLAVGVAFGAVSGNLSGASLAGAIALAMGIGIQNFPEGAAVSMPLRREGLSRTKSFLYGQASGIVEPIAGVLGVLAVVSMTVILPYALSFAAGAMIYVVVEELIPESQKNENTHIATMGTMVGFAIMMILDVSLG